MTRHALIIQSGYEPLAGFAHSARCMARLLGDHGFEVTICADRDATRDGILRAHAALLDRTRPDDAVAIYYVGHGARTTNRKYVPGSEIPPAIQNLCPTDYAETRDDDYRGISSWELSMMVSDLTAATANVTTLLECCFSESMIRGDHPPGMRRMRPKLTRAALLNHLEALRLRSPGRDPLARRDNPLAVRVAASGEAESSYQVLSGPRPHDLPPGVEPGAWIGGMTLRLAEILAELRGAITTWRSVVSELRARLVVQRPEVHGPSDRVVFSTTTLTARAFPVRSEGRIAVVDAGHLLGVARHDVYGVMPAGSAALDRARMIEEIEIDRVTATSSQATRAESADMQDLPTGCVAMPIRLAFARCAVAVTADAAVRQELAHAFDCSDQVRIANDADLAPIAELRVREHGLEIFDSLGLLYPGRPYPACLPEVMRDLEDLAAERRLRDLAPDEGIPSSDVSVDLIVTTHGDLQPRPDHGEPIGLHDSVAVRLVNRSEAVRYANVFNIGPRGCVARLTGGSGTRLSPNQAVYLGAQTEGALIGYGMVWPNGLPGNQPRLERVMVVLTEHPVDLSLLERGARDEAHSTARSALPRLEQAARGRARSGSAHPGSRFALLWRDCRLFPLAASLDLGVPQIDASPGVVRDVIVAGRLRLRISFTRLAPGRRVDLLLCLRSRTSPWRAHTLVSEGTLDLVLESLDGSVDVFVWTSRRTDDARTLPDLLATAPISDSEAMLRRPVDDPDAALATGARLQLAATARVMLRRLTDDVITAFRGSFGREDAGAHAYETSDAGFEATLNVAG